MADYSQGPIAGAPPAQMGYNNVNTTTMSSNPDNAFLSTVRPPYRPWLKFLPILILVFTIGVIAMIGYVVNVVGDGSQSLGFNLFAGAWTLIVGTFLILAFWNMPHIHYRWIIFILSVLSCIWWLAAFAYLASNTKQSFEVIKILESYSSLSSTYSFDPSDYGFRKRDLSALGLLEKRQSVSQIYEYIRNLPKYKTAASVMAGAATIGAIIWVIFCVFTVFYAMALFSSSPSQPAPAAPMGPVPVGQEPKIETYANVQPVYPPAAATTAPTFGHPSRPDSTFSSAPTYITNDPRDPRAAPGAEFLTPPPPGGYTNPQFEVDRNYTVSPLSAVEMPAVSQQVNLAEMPSAPAADHR
ncbi:hypothetical protein TWF569_002794 [Orbilia oligospora]|uniref:MARVEL domain-containing protein n=1 Tax=Orbilia oligospora TaxID=2813651 RepID=A0A7C8P116_ORBOL|nr:hypothetical protein TWF706_003894 [Orbilia oligospora]KAF3102728.1 hypothetical protein TWF102_004394 [Orbilia oligospora]KAF3110419.1 hypothetical protein TWF103_004694 [Orbilia oligospora]KAF3121192.1 hypothetical protein TWF569_002794 [Orbilia oligospora]KAF3124933.1 hypothetical protein TWF703_011141 [Orbilia oligospora]